MNDNAAIILLIAITAILVMFFSGSPDLQDAIIHKLMEGK